MTRPRKPTHFEMADYLHYWLGQDDDNNWEDRSASEEVEKDLVVVFDHYSCPYPFYQGSVMVRVTGGSAHVYVWKDGVLMSMDEFNDLHTSSAITQERKKG